MNILNDYEDRRARAAERMKADLKAASEGAPPEATGPAKVVDAVTTCSAALIIAELEALRAWIKDGSGYVRDDAPDEIARAITNRIEQLKATAGQPPNTH
jgi:hypothetical protein